MSNDAQNEEDIKEILLEIKDLLEAKNDEEVEYTDDTEPFVTLKLKLNSDKLKLLINEYKIYSILNGLLDFKRELYKYGYPNNEIIVKNDEVIKDDPYTCLSAEELKGRKCYIEKSFIEDKLRYLLEDAYTILNDRY